MKSEIKAAIERKKLIIGFNSVRKALLKKELKRVILASNCPKEMRERLFHYANVSNIPIDVLDEDSTALGITCKKGFNVLVVGIKK